MTDNTLHSKLKTLIAFRVFFVTVILGSVLVFQIGYEFFPYPSALQYIIVLFYVLTIIYLFVLNRVDSLKFAHLQLYMDVIAANTLIIFTGGVESWFTLILLLIVIEGAIVISNRAGFAAATLGSILYGMLINLQYYELIPIPYAQHLMDKDFFYKIFSIISALYITAYLTGQLASRLESRTIDLEDLSLFNREVIENTPSGLFTVDLGGVIQIFNRAAENITGFSKAAATGKVVSEILPFITRIEERQRIEEVVQFGNREKIIGITISKMKDAKGDMIGYIGIFQDLTELKKLAAEIEQKKQLAVIGEMSANMAHEIRNPLASLKSSVEILREGTISEEKKHRLMTIALNEMDRLNNIITEFLDYSRPRDLTITEFNLHKIINETLELLEKRDEAAQNVTFITDFTGPAIYSGDPEKLQQVFWNLGLNALDAMQDGGRLSVSTSLSNGNVRITFEDTGPGIDRDVIDKVFYPFFTTKRKGIGLGLSIAYRIIEKHNGIILVKSDAAKGTRFDILLPELT